MQIQPPEHPPSTTTPSPIPPLAIDLHEVAATPRANNGGDKRLLDWKLDFINPEFARKYDIEYNAEQLKLQRVSFSVGIASVVLPIVIGCFMTGFTFYYPLYATSITSAVIFVLALISLFFIPIVQRNAGLFSAIVIFITLVAMRISRVLVPIDLGYGPGIAEVPFAMIIQSLVLRLKVKHCIIANFFQVIIFCTSLILTDYNTQKEEFGFALPSLFFFAFSAYCGYFFEKRWKYGFLRRQLVDAEAAKLNWVCARDASLLRNIFPKNLSDELELQLAKSYVRSTGYSIPSTPRTPHASSSSTPTRTPRTPTPWDPSSSSMNISSPYLSPHSSPPLSARSSTVSTPSSSSSSTPTSTIIRAISNTAMKLHNLTASNPYTAAPSDPADSTPASLGDIDLSSFSHSHKLEEFPALKISIPSDEASPALPSFLSTNSPIIYLPEVVTTPCLTTPHAPLSLSIPLSTPRAPRTITYNTLPKTPRVLLTSGSPLKTPNHQPELQTFLNAAQHFDGSPIALSHFYPNVTKERILTLYEGFTSLSSSISPQELVTLLNRLFRKFDDIMDFHNLEKIRTIGDAYLCVGNMSVPLENPELEAVSAARKMISEVHKIKSTLSLRVGIASGPLIAGVTGITKWNYDIFGKPLSQANFMETLAPPNHIAITKAVYTACKDCAQYNFFPGKQLKDSSDAAHTSNTDVTEFFLMRGEISRSVSTESLVKDDSLSLLALSAPAGEDEELGAAMADILDYSDAKQTISAITESDLTADPMKLLGYTREDVEKEQQYLHKWWMTFSFKNRQFEYEFHEKTTETVHKYTSNLAIIFAVSIFVFVFVDILEPVPDKARPNHKVITNTTIGIIIGWLILYAVFVRFVDKRRGGTMLAAFSVNIYLYSLLVIFDQFPTGYNMSWIFLAIIEVSSCIRLPARILMSSQLLFVLTATVLVCTRDNLHNFLVEFFVYLAISFYSQRNIQRNLREQLLAIKTLKLDMYHQRVSQHRATLLIRNILPEDIIPRLHSSKSDSCVVRLFEHATIIFINITNLASLTENLDPANTFQIFNEIFTLFDGVTRSFNLEKIKTINTVYMVASGLPKQIHDHADVAVQFAIEINRVISKYFFPHFVRKRFVVRIGIASGPVVAGIIGKTKYSYDCWSDTTNTASRMESNGWDGHLQMTTDSYEMLINKNLPLEKRENVMIKGKGHMDTYVLRM